MGYIDFFLSYTWEDNESPPSGLPPGWVDRFEEGVLRELRDLWWQKIEHFRDTREIKTGVIEEEIGKALQRSIVFLPLLSASYIQSTWCVDELSKMNSVVSVDPLLPSECARRFLPVLLTPLSGKHLGDLQFTRYIRAYRSTGSGEDDWELLEPSERGSGSRMVREVAIALKEVLQATKGKGGPLYAEKGKVYVSVSPDLQFNRLGLQACLEASGFPVVPGDELLPTNMPAYVETVSKFLSDCRASFHGIGRLPSPKIGELEPLHYEFTQAKLACRGDHLARSVVWIPNDWETNSTSLRKLVEEIERDPELPSSVQVFRASFLELKDLIKTVFSQLPSKGDNPKQPPAPPHIYLLFRLADERDDHFKAFSAWIDTLGMAVVRPMFTGHPAHMRKHDQEAQGNASAIVVYCGTDADVWADGQYRMYKGCACASEGLIFYITPGTKDFSPPPDRARSVTCTGEFDPLTAETNLRPALTFK